MISINGAAGHKSLTFFPLVTSTHISGGWESSEGLIRLLLY